jgi:hypothetical protein
MEPGEPAEPLLFEGNIPVNRFLVNETMDGLCTAYLYTNADDPDNGGRGVIYSDNGNKPQTRRSTQETFINMRVNSGTPAGWRTGTFSTNTSISSGSYIWFGCFADFFWFPRFDYGSKVYAGDWYDVGDSVPNSYPPFYDGWFLDFKLSMYFEYTSAQNYVRTLTQGVSLTDSPKLTADYKRSMLQTVNSTDFSNSFISFVRQCVMTVTNSMNIERIPTFIRSAVEQAGITDAMKSPRELNRQCEEGVNTNDELIRCQGFYRGVNDSLKVTDDSSFPVIFIRSISETSGIFDTFRQWGAYIRGLYDEAGSIAETEHQAAYYRTTTETVQADGSVFRSLLIFVRLLTTSLVHDFILRRFLIAREELVLKSCVTREITLETKIN